MAQYKTKKDNFDVSLNRVPPQAVEVEKVVLGALMIDNEAFNLIGDDLKPEYFYDKRNEKVFCAIQELVHKGVSIDFITVSQQLKKDGENEVDELYLIDLTSNVASSAHVETHAEILRQQYKRRALINIGSILTTRAYDQSNDIEQVTQEAEKDLFELSVKNTRRSYEQITSITSKVLLEAQNAASNFGNITGVPSGFEKLDEITSGFQKSDLIIIAGRPAMGKTAFALSIAKYVAYDKNKAVAFFSLEMDCKQLTARLISNISEVNGTQIRNGKMDDEEWRRVDYASGEIERRKTPLFIDETPAISIYEIRSKVLKMIRDKKIELIIIDYLQLMTANGIKHGSRQEEVAIISRSLKALAKETNTPIIALSQLNRAVDLRDADDKRPQLSDLRESGSIEQDADMVIFVHRPEYYQIDFDSNGNSLKGMAQIIIAKHRNGAIGDVLLRFKGGLTRFENIENEIPPINEQPF